MLIHGLYSLRTNQLIPLGVALLLTLGARAETTLLLSATTTGQPGNAVSDRPSISADARYVAFHSAATNLISADTNSRADIFLLDRQSGAVTRVSKGMLGAESNGDSQTAALSAAGRYVAFESTATNLVSGETNAVQDIFVYDTSLSTTVRVSVSTGGVAGNAESLKPQLSSNGRFVAFVSYSNNFIAGESDSRSDVFLHDRDPDGNGTYDENNGTTVRASVDATGVLLAVASDFPSISADGNFISFSSGNYVYIYSRVAATAQIINPASDASSTFTSLSSDGRYVAFTSEASNLVIGDTNLKKDVFVYDRNLATTIRISVSQSGAQSSVDALSPVISADGRYVAFVTEASALNARVSHAGVTFDAISAATGGGGGGGGGTTANSYVWRRDLTLGTVVRAGSASGGAAPNASSGYAAMSSDGTWVAFSSLASNLTCATDNNAATDVFLRDLRSTTATPSCGTSAATKTSAGGALSLSFLILFGLSIAWRIRAHRLNHLSPFHCQI